MADERPFGSWDQIAEKANRIWWSLQPGDWLEAFRSHPRIGEKQATPPASSKAQEWSIQEQSGAGIAAPETAQALVEWNHKYEEKFGYIYIVCATGKSAEEMLAMLQDRSNNPSDIELRIAAGEQAKITQLRLKKLINRGKGE